MEWFKKSKKGLLSTERKETPDNLWVKCEICKEILFKKELVKVIWVCKNCGGHFRISSSDYLKILLDEGSFDEIDRNLASKDILGFTDKKSYAQRIAESQRKSGLREAVVTGTAYLNGYLVAIGIMDFAFLGGSMGSAVGEKIARLIRHAISENLPLIIVSASGGARMQEGAFSLMQMAKTTAMLARLGEKRLPFISVLTHPTTGGVTASFSMLGDVIVAEPKALIGFAGPRVIRETIRQELPEGFQRSEFLLEHGFIDLICDRREMKQCLTTLLDHLWGKDKISKQMPSRKSDLYITHEGKLTQKPPETV